MKRSGNLLPTRISFAKSKKKAEIKLGIHFTYIMLDIIHNYWFLTFYQFQNL